MDGKSSSIDYEKREKEKLDKKKIKKNKFRRKEKAVVGESCRFARSKPNTDSPTLRYIRYMRSINQIKK